MLRNSSRAGGSRSGRDCRSAVLELRLEEVDQLPTGEGGAEHGGVPEDLPVGGREMVDLGGDGRVDRVGERIEGGAGPVGPPQLLEEHRVAHRPLGQHPDLVGQHRGVVGGRQQGLGGLVHGQAGQLEGPDVVGGIDA